MESHSGVAYSGWEPTSRYSRAPLARKTLLLRPHETTRRKRYRATSSGLRRRWPRSVQVTPYSFSSPKMRRSISVTLPVRLPTGAPFGVASDAVDRLHMVPLACELSPFEARVLAARLGAEGVVWELRGGSSVYPVG